MLSDLWWEGFLPTLYLDCFLPHGHYFPTIRIYCQLSLLAYLQSLLLGCLFQFYQRYDITFSYKATEEMAHKELLKTLDRSKHDLSHSLRGKVEGPRSSNIVGLLKYKKFRQVLTLYGRTSVAFD